MSLTLITAPAVEPLELEDAREHCRIDSNDEDRLLYAYIGAARRYVETFTNRQLITAVWELQYDCFPYCIEVPLPPLVSIVSIKYLDTAGVEQTISASDYIVDAPAGETCSHGRVTPTYAEVWPTSHSVISAVRVRFQAGYGANPANVPEGLKSALREYVATLWKHREDNVTGTISIPAPVTVDRLLWPYKTFARAA